jgi:sulfiredoxin
MLKRENFAIEKIYVPVKQSGTLDPKRVEKIAQSMLVDGQTTPFLVRPDGPRFVLVEGLHRQELCWRTLVTKQKRRPGRRFVKA